MRCLILLLLLTACGDQRADELPSCKSFANAWPNKRITLFVVDHARPECTWYGEECEIETLDYELRFYCEGI